MFLIEYKCKNQRDTITCCGWFPSLTYFNEDFKKQEKARGWEITSPIILMEKTREEVEKLLYRKVQS